MLVLFWWIAGEWLGKLRPACSCYTQFWTDSVLLSVEQGRWARKVLQVGKAVGSPDFIIPCALPLNSTAVETFLNLCSCRFGLAVKLLRNFRGLERAGALFTLTLDSLLCCGPAATRSGCGRASATGHWVSVGNPSMCLGTGTAGVRDDLALTGILCHRLTYVWGGKSAGRNTEHMED